MVIVPSVLVLLVFFVTVGDAFREVKDEEFPFQVSIQNMQKKHICGGAIITPKWVLTSSACMKTLDSVSVCFGRADSNNPLGCIKSDRIKHQNTKKNRLALIELQNPIEFSNTVKQAKLPTAKAVLRNTTKLSGWKNDFNLNVNPNLYAYDRYYIMFDYCKNDKLEEDEFCGEDGEGQNLLRSGGALVSKSNVILGIQPDFFVSAFHPVIYVKLSEHEQWFKDILDTDARLIQWVNEIPKDSATSNSAINLALFGISAILTLCL